MAAIRTTAERFFDDCETGKGWDACSAYCHPGAAFTAQAEALGDITTVGGKLRHLTKVWNDVFSLKQLGWT